MAAEVNKAYEATLSDTGKLGPELSKLIEDEPEFFEAIAMATTLEAALKTKRRHDAIEATKKELRSHRRLKTWHYIKKPSDRSASVHNGVEPSSTIIKEKYNSRGEFMLVKARLVDNGSRTDDANYDILDKTSPTADNKVVMLTLAIAQFMGYKVECFDVPTAYLNARLPNGKKHVMRIGKATASILVTVDPEAKEYLQDNGCIYIELDKAVYGLPESGKLWHDLFTSCLRTAGYKELPGDTCVWKRTNGRDVSILLLIVDDCLHAYSSVRIRDELYVALRKSGLPEMVIQALTKNSPVSFCGINVEKTDTGAFTVSQPGYVESLLAKYPHAKEHPTPLPSNFADRKITEEQASPLPSNTQYLRLVMELAWLLRTRFDLAAAIAYKQTRCAAPRKVDWQDLLHIVGYLKATATKVHTLQPSSLQPNLYVDAAFAVHCDRRSHTGAIMCVGNAAIECKSSKQKLNSLNTAECELIALSDSADTLLDVGRKLAFFGIKVNNPMTLFQDNTSTITIAYMGRPSANAKRRFIDIRYFWLKQYLDNRIIALKYIPSKSQLADPAASIRIGAAFRAWRDYIMGYR